MLSFVVEKVGSLSNITILTDTQKLTLQFQKIIKKLSIWEPAYINGVPARYNVVEPFIIELEYEAKEE